MYPYIHIHVHISIFISTVITTSISPHIHHPRYGSPMSVGMHGPADTIRCAWPLLHFTIPDFVDRWKDNIVTRYQHRV